MTRVLIIEPHASGHHASYLRWTAESIIDRGWHAVLATTAETLRHPELQPFLAPHNLVTLRILDGIPTPDATVRWWSILQREWAYWRLFQRIVGDELRRGPLDAVVFPYLDYTFFVSGVLSAPSAGVPWCGIAMRLWHSTPGVAAPALTLRWRIARRLLSEARCRALFCINPSVETTPASWLNARQRSRLRYLPDPVDEPLSVTRDVARTALGLDSLDIAVLVYGSISARKGLLELATALSGDARFARHVLVVAGCMTDDMRAAASIGPLAALRDDRRLLVMDRTFDVAGQAQIFSAADIAWLGYVGHPGMSGVLVLAGRSGLPVIGCESGEIGWMVARHDLGEIAAIGSTDSIRGALARLAGPERRAHCAANGRRAFATHTSERFKQMLQAAIVPGNA